MDVPGNVFNIKGQGLNSVLQFFNRFYVAEGLEDGDSLFEVQISGILSLKEAFLDCPKAGSDLLCILENLSLSFNWSSSPFPHALPVNFFNLKHEEGHFLVSALRLFLLGL